MSDTEVNRQRMKEIINRQEENAKNIRGALLPLVRHYQAEPSKGDSTLSYKNSRIVTWYIRGPVAQI